MYITFQEYALMGGTISEAADFSRAEYRARLTIDAETHNRIRDETPVRECVKCAAFELIEQGQAQKTSAEKFAAGISSQSNDGVSVSYADGASMERYYARQARETLLMYLGGEVDARGVPLMYAGVDRDGERS